MATAPASRSDRPDSALLRVSDRWPQMLAAWTGPAATLFALLGMVIVGGFIPAQHPAAGGAEIAGWDVDNVTRIRVGMLLSAIGFTLFIPFGVAIAVQLLRSERRPLLAFPQIACVAIASLEGVMSCVIWAAAAYRPGAIDPDITRALNDLGWIAFLFDVAPFSLWMIAIAIAILRDPDETFPRWLGYFNVFAALVIEPASLIIFFKTGPLAYSGLLALYVPFGVFFAWILLMTPFLIRAIRSEPVA